MDLLASLNPDQRSAAEHGDAPLLIIAGAGSGKTNTLAHRVASLIARGADPRRLLLLTFSRRAAAEMTRRTQGLLAAHRRDAQLAPGLRWSGTFHAIANRLLRQFAPMLGLDPAFTVLDRQDAADLLDLVRVRLKLDRSEKRFPRKATCLSIYSRCANSQQPLQHSLDSAFPWCTMWHDQLRSLFGEYVQEKHKQHVLDYDDLLLYWSHAMRESSVAERIRGQFDHILVDEFQDTNRLQNDILLALRPDGQRVTVVGDDAQSIYSFRAADVDNILSFPHRFDPPARVVTLERNYRSTQPILDVANAVIAQAKRAYQKRLYSERRSQQKPVLVTTESEHTQVDYVVDQILEQREAGVELRRQAVLFRAAHHSDALEVELSRRNIPFVKYGGLKFLEAAHVKDVLAVLRFAENARDAIAAFRMFQLLPGIGPAWAQRALDHLGRANGQVNALHSFPVPAAAQSHWPALASLVERVAEPSTDWHGQLGAIVEWYQPHLERLYDAAHVRAGDLEQLREIAGTYRSRERFLTDLTLDPPQASGDEAVPPHLDEDYLILSTIHSAKGQEWDVVYVINAADGCIPSDLATGDEDQIEEERRLFYVALTRARDALHVVHPQRYFVRQQHRHGDRHLYTPVTRFLPAHVRAGFESIGHRATSEGSDPARPVEPMIDIAAAVARLWE
ncbi:MAG: ATP-dependent helicase [Myxococcales bacterium FL481]|nr:MAG: ATP-dependent helicase [Myxococcales bacterium FL481]